MNIFEFLSDKRFSYIEAIGLGVVAIAFNSGEYVTAAIVIVVTAFINAVATVVKG